MDQNGEGKNKRDNFRLQIRRKQIDSIMAQNRKRYALQSLRQTLQHENLQLYRRSLVKNLLIPDLPIILPSFSKKLKSCSEISTLQFTTLLFSNMLQDEISLNDRQYIYSMCVDEIKFQRIRKMSPLVEIRLYESLVFCMDSFDQNVQIQIQESIIGRLRQIIEGTSLCLERLPSNYNMQNLMPQLIQICLTTLLYFYSPQVDHNVVLVYKIQRTILTIIWLIEWWFNQVQWEGQEQQCFLQLKEYGKFINTGTIKKYANWNNLILLLNLIYGNISQASVSMINNFDQRIIKKLIKCFMKQISFHDEMLCEANQYACKTMTNLLMDEPLLVYQLKESDIRVLLNDFKKVFDKRYLCQLLNLLLKIVESPTYSTNLSSGEHILSNCHRKEIISSIIQILLRKEEHTDQILMQNSLMVVIGILYKEFEEGKRDLRDFFYSQGGQRLVQKIKVSIKSEILREAIQDSFESTDLC